MAGFTLIGPYRASAPMASARNRHPRSCDAQGWSSGSSQPGSKLPTTATSPLALYRTGSPDRHQQNLEQLVGRSACPCGRDTTEPKWTLQS